MATHRLRAAVLCAAFACLSLPAGIRAAPADPLAPLAALEGGVWHVTGKWPDGTPLATDVRYFWGATKRVLHFETHDVSGDRRRLLYEGMLFFDPRRDLLVQYNVKPSGAVDELAWTAAGDGRYEVQGTNTRSTIRFVGADELRWELRVQQAGEWKAILDAAYRRER